MSSVNLFSILFDRSLAFGRQKKDEAATEKSSSCNHHAIRFSASGPERHLVRCNDMSEVEVKADLNANAEFGRD